MICLRRAGFTLLEVMVVVVIISIVIGVVTLNVDTRDKEVGAAIERLAALTRLASEEAVLRSRELVLQIEPDGYRFMQLGGGGVIPLEGDSVLRPRSLPEGLELSLLLEDEPVELDVEEATDGEETARQPRIFLLSSGEVTPFELRVRDHYTGFEWNVVGELTGLITVEALPNQFD